MHMHMFEKLCKHCSHHSLVELMKTIPYGRLEVQEVHTVLELRGQ